MRRYGDNGSGERVARNAMSTGRVKLMRQGR